MTPLHVVVLTAVLSQTRWIVGFGAGATASQVVDVIHTHPNIACVRHLPFAASVDVKSAADLRNALANVPGVRYIEEDRRIVIRFRAPPNDPLYVQQWHLHSTPQADPSTSINAEPAWQVTLGQSAGGPIRVAVVDDGFDLNHPDLVDRFTSLGRDFADAPLIDDDPSASATDYHGTQTAGLIGATGNNGLGVIGVCPECELLPVRLIGNGGPNDLYEIDSSAAAEAIVWATDNGAAVINNSWGPPDGVYNNPQHDVLTFPIPTALRDALIYAATEGRNGLGSIITWSAGNGGELSTYDFFASDPRVLAIGAIDASARLARYSDFGPTVSLVAPSSGEPTHPDIYTTDLMGSAGASADDYSSSFGGTSASAAIAAGAAALLVAAYPNLTAAQIIESLLVGASPIDPTRGQYQNGRSKLYGYGKIDIASSMLTAATYVDGCTAFFELCGNNMDDNCNGNLDTDEAQCTPCLPNAPHEVCDGIDNNCDGQIDETFVCQTVSRPTCAPCRDTSQCKPTAVCRGSSDFGGTWCFEKCFSDTDCSEHFHCIAGACLLTTDNELRTCVDYLGCYPESCDGLDNDCDGVVDNISEESQEYLTQQQQCHGPGVCAQQGASCQAGIWECSRSEWYQVIETRCDGLDNDCNGAVDEALLCSYRLYGTPQVSFDLQPNCSAVHDVIFFGPVLFALFRPRRLATSITTIDNKRHVPR